MRICKIKFYKYIYPLKEGGNKNIFSLVVGVSIMYGEFLAQKCIKKKIAEIFILAFKKEIKIQYVTNKKKYFYLG